MSQRQIAGTAEQPADRPALVIVIEVRLFLFLATSQAFRPLNTPQFFPLLKFYPVPVSQLTALRPVTSIPMSVTALVGAELSLTTL